MSFTQNDVDEILLALQTRDVQVQISLSPAAVYQRQLSVPSLQGRATSVFNL